MGAQGEDPRSRNLEDPKSLKGNKMPKEKLNDKQKMFVSEYCIDKNAKQAAIRTGYSPKTAEVQGSRMLSNVKVREEIDKQLEKQFKKNELTAEMVDEVIAGMVLTPLSDLYEEGPDGTKIPKSAEELTPIQRLTIQETTLMTGADGSGFQRIKQYDRLKAIEIFSKRRGDYHDNNKTTNNIANMHVNILDINSARRRARKKEIEE